MLGHNFKTTCITKHVNVCHFKNHHNEKVIFNELWWKQPLIIWTHFSQFINLILTANLCQNYVQLSEIKNIQFYHASVYTPWSVTNIQLYILL